ncbi:hypothetical protein [Aureimonas psammosilenae]|nr:hypothetical protein [Aureimonas psammosilenae]
MTDTSQLTRSRHVGSYFSCEEPLPATDWELAVLRGIIFVKGDELR